MSQASSRTTPPTWITPPGCNAAIKYGGNTELQRALRTAVTDHLAQRGMSPYGGAAMLRKTGIILTWLVATYLLLLLWAESWWTFAALGISMGLALAAVGFSIQHDGGHGAYAERPWLSRVAALALDGIGGSSYMWHHKHNVLHHTYPNVEQVDDDISQSPWLRLSKTDPYLPVHRYQHWYAWVLYAFVTPKWVLVDDFRRIASQRAGARHVPPPTGATLRTLLLGKVFAYSWLFIIPLAVHGPSWGMLALYVFIAWVWGCTLATVFQLAHCNADAETMSWPKDGETLEHGWAEQQLATTVNFSPGNAALTWYIGGLNYQIEHHLFPKVCHLHYPALSPIVRKVCEAHGVEYRVQPTMLESLRSHIVHLRRLGASA